MTPSYLSSTHHGHIYNTLPQCQNWTTHPRHLLLPRHPSHPVHHLPLWRAPWSPTTSTGKHFPIKRSIIRTQLLRRKRRCLSHVVKRGRTAPLRSEFFGPCHYPDHSVTRHHQHQHHVASHKHLRTVLRNRGDVNCLHHLRRSPLHKSTFRSYYTVPFLFFITVRMSDVSHSLHHFFRTSFMFSLPIIVLIT